MQTYIVQAVQRSSDGTKSVRVANRWPYSAMGLDEVKAFVDATPAFDGWDKATVFEILDTGGVLIASRPFRDVSQDQAAWT